MSTRELIAGQAPTLEDLGDALRPAFTVEPHETWESDRVLYDTFDALLREEGLTLVHELGRLLLHDRATLDPVASEPMDEPPAGPLLATALPAGRLRDEVAEVIEVRALLPQARILERSASARVLDSLQKTVVRLTVVAPSVVLPSGREVTLTARVRLHTIRGYEKARRKVEKALVTGLGLADGDLPLADEAVLAAGGKPAGVSARPEVPIAPGERTDVAAARVLGRLLEVMDANLGGTIADTDSEFLHDYRVAVRRSRSVQRELRDAFPPDELQAMRAEFKWLQTITGESRDLDVYVLEFDGMRALVPESMRAELAPLLTVLRQRRLIARREMVRELRSDRARVLRADWVELLDGLADRPEDDRPLAGVSIDEAASGRIRRVYRKMLRMGEAITAESPPEDYHELRKKGKELRYLLELFGAPLHDAAVVKPMVRALKRLQDVLGRHQDREVQVTMLGSLRSEVAAMPGGPAALMAMGVLIERLEEDAAAARAEFAEAFEAFAAAEQRRLVKRTFR